MLVARVMYTSANSKSHWGIVAEGDKFHTGNAIPHS